MCARPSRRLVPHCLAARDACIVIAKWRDVRLRSIAPVNLHAIRPRLHAEVSSLCESLFKARTRIQTDPTPYARVDSIGSDNPLRLPDLFTKDSAFAGQTRDGGIPKQRNSALFRSFHHLLVKHGSTHSKTACSQKVCFH